MYLQVLYIYFFFLQEINNIFYLDCFLCFIYETDNMLAEFWIKFICFLLLLKRNKLPFYVQSGA
jgi:hypothetical protein